MGYEFLEQMVVDLSRLLGAKYVFVGEILPALGQVQSLARAVDGELGPGIEYALHGTPCENVAGGEACFIEDGVAERYPEDRALARDGIRSYYGFPLVHSDGTPVGLVAALHTEPLPANSLARTAFHLLAGRAGAEIVRLRFDREQARRVAQSHHHLTILNELSLSPAMRHGKVEELSQILVRHLLEGLDADRAGVWMTDESGLTLQPVRFASRDGTNDPGISALPLAEVKPLLLMGRERKAMVFRNPEADASLPPTLAAHLARQRVRSRVDSAIRLGSEVVGVVSVSSRDADRRWSEGELRFVADAGDLMGHAILEARRREAEQDRTRLELELERARKMEALGGLAGGIAHDFNNILASILGNAELAQYEELEDVPELMQEILKSAEQGRNLVNQIMQFARSEDIQRSRVNLCKVVQDVARTVRPLVPDHVTLVVDACPTCTAVLGDDVQLGQVILNLCTNALEAMSETGPGTLTLRVEAEAPGLGIHTGPAESMTVQVKDTGPGIPEEARKRLFEPFFTTRKGKGGTGLGLAIVDRTVRAHGGTIDVASDPGKGTTFTLRFPVRNDPTELAALEGPRRRTLRILAVDDDEETLVLVRALLEHLRHEVLTFDDPSEALAALEDETEVDVVLVDLLMKGLSGLQVAKAVRERRPSARTIIMSASPDRVGSAHRDTVHAVLAKPFSLPELAGALSSLG